MNKKTLFMILAVAVIIAVCGAASADSPDIKSHEFNYAGKVTFNISDNLTNDTGNSDIAFGEEIEYDYGWGQICSIYPVSADDEDVIDEALNNGLLTREPSNATSQGYETYIFEMDKLGYMAIIDTGDITEGFPLFEQHFKCFKGTFDTLEEAELFCDTFKIS